METWHVKLEHDRALDGKKQLLSSEIDILKLTRNIKNYSVIRKRETAVNNKIKVGISEIKAKMNQLSASFPKTHEKKIEPEENIKKVRKIIKKEEKTGFEKELEEIQDKLARLEKL